MQKRSFEFLINISHGNYNVIKCFILRHIALRVESYFLQKYILFMLYNGYNNRKVKSQKDFQ